jgi:hypothetical protein
MFSLRTRSIPSVLALLVWMAACTSSGPSSAPGAATVEVIVAPTSGATTPGGTLVFTTTVTGTTSTLVDWTVQEGSAGGTTSSAGVYTAPATAGTFHVVATSRADPTKSASAPVTVSAPPSSVWVWGVTTDDPTTNTAQQVEALRSLPKRTVIRTVFDPPSGGGPTAADYASSVAALAGVADVLGCPVDSSEMSRLSLTAIQARIAEYLQALGSSVAIWEVGNEVTGNWLGNGVVAKIETMFDAVKRAGKPTALTLFYENPATPGYDMIPWVDANIPAGHRLRDGLDYVLVSYYEDQNGGHQLTQSELEGMFKALATRFPNARLGIGEFGWGNTIPSSPGGDATRAALLRRFYGYRIPAVPSFVGGSFYWHFLQTMVPMTKPDWSVLDTLMRDPPAP